MILILADSLLQFVSRRTSLMMGLTSLLTSYPRKNPLPTATLSPLISKTLLEIRQGELLCPREVIGSCVV